MSGGVRKSSAEKFIEQLNTDNAKLFACTLVTGFLIYHGLLHLQYGADSCTWLLSAGRYKGDHEWQPYGCMLHRYTQTDARRCLRYLAFWEKHNTFSYIGDSRIQQLYQYFTGVVLARSQLEGGVAAGSPNYTHIDSKLKLSIQFTYSPIIDDTMIEQFRTWAKQARPPSVIVASSGLDLVARQNITGLVASQLERNASRLVQPIEELVAQRTIVVWKLMEPVDQQNLPEKYSAVTNANIYKYNRIVSDVVSGSGALRWESAALIASGSAGAGGGVTLSERALRHCAQVLLNMYCNDHMSFNDGSCCATPEPTTALQLTTVALFLLCMAIVCARALWRWSEALRRRLRGGYRLVHSPAPAPAPPAQPAPPSPVAALARLGLIMAYFYLCDRTNYFMKENKYYSEWSFWLPVGYVFALGLFFTEDSKSTKVMHREQTYEWKGWMQLVVLVCQVTGASRVLAIHMLYRTIASAYLFLTGYGHLYYTMQTGDTSLVRYFRVVFRLNFLTVILCLCMNRPYQFYNFVPLVSFWFTLMFVLLALPPHISKGGAGVAAAATGPDARPYHYVAVVLKITGLVAITTVLYMSEVFFQKIFLTRPWKALFVNTDDDIRQWWLRWKQDRYSVAYGLVWGAGWLAAQRLGLVEEAGAGLLVPAGAALSLALVALLALAAYITFVSFCTNVFDCNEIHSYVAFVPILSYVLLRNLSATLRSRHSSLFAWFGHITLELFASQSHIWLAADTHGVLVLVPSAPVLNLIVTSFIFVMAAHEIHRLTLIILPHAVPDDWKLVLRNVCIFLVVLVPIGIHDGMF